MSDDELDVSQYHDLAVTAATRAGTLLMEARHKHHLATYHKQGQSCNLVTEVDLQSEQLIVTMIGEAFPGHCFLSEEHGRSVGTSEFMWIIDPLDGTNNFAHGFPVFAVSVALYHRGAAVLGVVYDPTRHELFTATRGRGAFLNNRRLSVSSAAALPECLLATGFYYERGALMRRTLQHMERFFQRNILGIRRMGWSLDLCYIAAGRFDGFWELKLGPWDYAAAALLVTEAGGTVTAVDGRPYNVMMGNMLASNGRIHSEVRDRIVTGAISRGFIVLQRLTSGPGVAHSVSAGRRSAGASSY